MAAEAEADIDDTIKRKRFRVSLKNSSSVKTDCGAVMLPTDTDVSLSLGAFVRRQNVSKHPSPRWIKPDTMSIKGLSFRSLAVICAQAQAKNVRWSNVALLVIFGVNFLGHLILPSGVGISLDAFV